MPWYRFEKFFKGGSHHDYLFLKPSEGRKKVIEKQLQEEMEDWGNRTDGGKSGGFRVYCKYISKVPKKELEKKLEHVKKYHVALGPIFKDKEKETLEWISFLEGQIKKQRKKAVRILK